MASETVLSVDGIHTFYGSIEALKGISLEVRQGEIVTLIGANGAGKSTTLRSINGLNHPRQGTIVFQGTDVTSMPPHQIVKRGISQSPEGRKLFPRMSVTENLEMGAFQRNDRAEMKEDMDRVFSLFPRLAERKTQKAGTMSGGEQQMLAIGRALMARPKLLLLDEPSMGLAPIFVEKIFEIVREINEQGTPILLVEQNALMALDTADRGYVLETGTIALADAAKALRENEQVRTPYLGEAQPLQLPAGRGLDLVVAARHALRFQRVRAEARGRATAVGELEGRRLDVAQVVEACDVELAADQDLGRLLRGLECRAAAKVVERQPPVLELGGQRHRPAGVEPTEAERVRQHEHVRREAVPAEVRALVDLSRKHALERQRHRRATDRAARIARPVRAHEVAALSRGQSPGRVRGTVPRKRLDEEHLRALGDEIVLASPRLRPLDELPARRDWRRAGERFAELERQLRAAERHARTRSGKYGGASRKPIRNEPPARPSAICTAAPTPCVGTSPSARAAS